MEVSTAMTKPEFAALRENLIKLEPIDKIKNIHLFFSSSDEKGLTLKYSKLLLENFPFLKLQITVGNGFKNIDKLKELTSKN